MAMKVKCGILGVFTLLNCLVTCFSAQYENVADTLSKLPTTFFFHKLLETANLIAVLQGLGPFTVFAPNNEAFDILGPGVAETLTMDKNSQYLVSLVQYHMTYATVMSTHMQPDAPFKSWTGEDIHVTSLIPLMLNQRAKVLSPDHLCSNGLLHIIDRVLLPPGFTFPPAQRTLLQLLSLADYLGTYTQAVVAVGWEEKLQQIEENKEITLFMPDDEAFAELGLGVSSALLLPANRDRLIQLMSYHAANGVLPSTRMNPSQQVNSIEGGAISISQTDPQLILNGKCLVRSPDVPATNGMLHIIEKVMLPPNWKFPDKSFLQFIRMSPEFSVLAAALEASELTSLFNGQAFTLFAPTNAAFEDLGVGMATSLLLPSNKAKLVELVSNHIVQGELSSHKFEETPVVNALSRGLIIVEEFHPLVVNGLTATTQDAFVTDGVLHVVPQVMRPLKWQFPDQDLFKLVSREARLTWFVRLVTRAGLSDNLKNAPGPFTVLVPTDESWEALGQLVLNTLFDLKNEAMLQKLLNYHIIPGQYQSQTLRNPTNVPTLEGQEIRSKPWTAAGGWQGIAFQDANPPVMFNDEARVVMADALATNGLVHIIDKVLVPEAVIFPTTTTTFRFGRASSAFSRRTGAATLACLLCNLFAHLAW